MKSTIIAVSLLLASLATKAQFSKSDSLTQKIIASDTLTPRKGEKQVTFALADNSGFFVFRKYLCPKLALRFGFSGNYNITSQKIPQPSTPDAKSVYRYFLYQVSFGLQHSFGNFKRFEPYMGLDLGFGNRMEYSSYTTYTPYTGFQFLGLGPNTVIETEQEKRVKFSPSASFTPLVGFNYYIAERFALGAEYRVPLVNFNMISNSKSTVTQRYSYGNSTTREIRDPDIVSVSGNLRGIAYITATLFLFCK